MPGRPSRNASTRRGAWGRVARPGTGSGTGNGGPCGGRGREDAREAIGGRLDAEGLLGEVRPHRYRLGHCDRCGTVIEPWLSEQWWLAMGELAQPAIEALRDGEITVYPDSW